jgi:hypothetical protein
MLVLFLALCFTFSSALTKPYAETLPYVERPLQNYSVLVAVVDFVDIPNPCGEVENVRDLWLDGSPNIRDNIASLSRGHLDLQVEITGRIFSPMSILRLRAIQ